MAETNPSNQDSNPTPGGDISTEGSAVPPYQGRSDGGDEYAPSSTARAYGSETPEHEPEQPGADVDQPDSDMAPDNVGESVNRRGENVVNKEGKEAGRHEEGEDASRETDRQVGSSDNRDQSAV